MEKSGRFYKTISTLILQIGPENLISNSQQFQCPLDERSSLNLPICTKKKNSVYDLIAISILT